MLAILAALLGVPKPSASEPDVLAENTLGRRSAPAVIEVRDGIEGGPETADAVNLRDKMALARRLTSGGSYRSMAGRRTPGAISTTYENAAPARVQEVVDAAAAAWDEVLRVAPGAPVEISVMWTDLGRRLLGQAGTEGEYRDALQFPTDRWYPAALANQVANFDVNGPTNPEILIELNSGLGDDWYISTEGKPGPGQVDLYSVVLHEIGHGLGFLGSAAVDRSGVVSVDYDPPSIYDDFVRDRAGAQLTSMDERTAARALTSEGLMFDVGSGRMMALSSPNRFVNGSSYSHFDEAVASGEPGALMTPSLKNGEVQRRLDAAVIGVLDQIGWDLDVALLPPSLDAVVVGPAVVDAKWSEDWSLPLAFPSHYVASATAMSSTDVMPPGRAVEIDGAGPFAVSLSGLQNGTTYRLTVTPERSDGGPGREAATTVLLPANPNPVRALALDADSGVELAWSAPVGSGAPIQRYEVQYRSASVREWSPAITTGSSPVRLDLEPGRYWFRVRATSDVGPGVWLETPLTGLEAAGVRMMPLDAQLGRLYTAYFGRVPDDAGMDYWTEVRSRGGSIGMVADSFAASEEFRSTYGRLDDPSFVGLVYRNVLGRDPDPDGYRYWVDQLRNGMARGRVMVGFSDSPEFIRSTATVGPQSAFEGSIERAFLAVLRRGPTAPELQRWRSRVTPSRIAAVAADLLASTEFTSVHGDLNDSQFIDRIHLNVRGTPVDGTDHRLWSGELRAGRSRADLVVRLAQTPQFVAITGTGH